MPTQPQYTLSDLSERFQLELIGDGDTMIDGVGTLAKAGESQVTFLANRAYRFLLPDTAAGAVILKQADVPDCPVNCLVSDDPYLAYARMAALFDLRPRGKPGIHETAVVSGSARLGRNISIGPHAVIGDECEIGDGCDIGPGVVIYDRCRLGEGCLLHANVTLGFGVVLGRRVQVHPGAVIGADGFGIAFAVDRWEKVPQLGGVVIGDDCEIGCNTTIDRGAIGDTVLEEDVRIDNLCQVGHNVRIGAHSALAGMTGVAGSTVIGKYCLFGGRIGLIGHLSIADKTSITAGTNVFKSIKDPGSTWSSQVPAQPAREWQRNLARLRKLDQLAMQVRELEKKLEQLNQND